MAGLFAFHGSEVVVLEVGRPGDLCLVGNVSFSCFLRDLHVVFVACFVLWFLPGAGNADDPDDAVVVLPDDFFCVF